MLTLDAKEHGDDSILVTWADSNSHLYKYYVVRRSIGKGNTDYELLVIVDARKNSYLDSGLDRGHFYNYIIWAAKNMDEICSKLYGCKVS